MHKPGIQTSNRLSIRSIITLSVLILMSILQGCSKEDQQDIVEFDYGTLDLDGVRRSVFDEGEDIYFFVSLKNVSNQRISWTSLASGIDWKYFEIFNQNGEFIGAPYQGIPCTLVNIQRLDLQIGVPLIFGKSVQNAVPDIRFDHQKGPVRNFLCSDGEILESIPVGQYSAKHSQEYIFIMNQEEGDEIRIHAKLSMEFEVR